MFGTAFAGGKRYSPIGKEWVQLIFVVVDINGTLR